MIALCFDTSIYLQFEETVWPKMNLECIEGEC